MKISPCAMSADLSEGTEIWLQFKLFNPLKTRSNRLGLF